MTTRRRLFRQAIRFAAISSFCKPDPAFSAASGFWNKKPSAAWSPEEILQLTTRSPWAHETNVDFEAAEGPPVAVAGSGSPYAGENGNGRGATIERSSGERPSGTLKGAPVLVRWESAQPIRDALLVPLPRDFADHYVLSVSNIPPEAMNPEKRRSAESPPITLETMIGELQAAATLEAAGKEPAGCGKVSRVARSESTYLFGFSKELLPITASDKEVQFVLRTTRVSVKAKFQPRDMIYRGSVAL